VNYLGTECRSKGPNQDKSLCLRLHYGFISVIVNFFQVNNISS